MSCTTWAPSNRIRIWMLLLVLAGTTAFGQNTILGALEDVPGNYTDTPNSRSVRVIFQKKGDDWQPFPSKCPAQDCLKKISSEYPGEVVWTIGFDGRILGRVTGKTPEDFVFYSHIGLQNIIGGHNIPTVGKRSTEYGGYIDAMVYRPLVANSQPQFKDPESWKPSQLPTDLTRLVRQGFRQKFPKLCKVSKRNGAKVEPFYYRDDDVRLGKAYISRKHWVLIRVWLHDAIGCGDAEAGSEIDDMWFVIDPLKSIRYLGEGMRLVDAGDYDNDGKSELLFSINRDNKGGYELFYHDFKSHAIFEFDYH